MDTSTPTQHSVTVALRGEFDLARADDLRHSLLDADLPSRHVTADLSAVAFMDSTALRSLLEVRQALAAEGGSLRLTSVPPRVATLFDITRTAELFGLTDGVSS